MKKKWSFRKRLLFSFVALALVGLGVASTLSAHLAMSIARSLTLESLESGTRSVEELLQFTYADQLERQKTLSGVWKDRFFSRLSLSKTNTVEIQSENQVTRSKVMMRVPQVFVDGKPIKDDRLVDEISFSTGELVILLVKTPEGLLRLSSTVRREDGSRAVNTFIPSDSPIATAIEKGEHYFGLTNILGKTFVGAYEPWKIDGRVVGAFFLGIPETGSTGVRAMLRSRKIRENGYYYVLDGKGTLMMHPSLEGKNLAAEKDADGFEFFKRILETRNGVVEYRWPTPGGIVNKLAVYRHVPAFDWIVVASIDKDEAFADVVRLRSILAGVTALAILVMIIVITVLSNRIAATFQRLETQISNTSNQVESESRNLTDASSSLASAANEQAAGLQETVSALEEIKSTIFKNLEHTENSEKVSSRLQQVGHDSGKVVTDLQRAMQAIETSNQTVHDEVEKSHEEIRQISALILDLQKKTQVINDIVFQTRLLSFNASVEASRAGEHGKGFAVVAEEVGSLANLSGNASKEISTALSRSVERVNEIIEKSSRTVGQLLSESGNKVRAGVETTERCKQSLEQIIAGIEDTHRAMSEIANASREQSKGVDEISKALQEIDSATQQNAAAANQTEGIAGSMLGSSEELKASVAEFNEYLNGSSGEIEAPSERPAAPRAATSRPAARFKAAA